MKIKKVKVELSLDELTVIQESLVDSRVSRSDVVSVSYSKLLNRLCMQFESLRNYYEAFENFASKTKFM